MQYVTAADVSVSLALLESFDLTNLTVTLLTVTLLTIATRQ